jgi:hypothetical protein
MYSSETPNKDSFTMFTFYGIFYCTMANYTIEVKHGKSEQLSEYISMEVKGSKTLDRCERDA